MRQIRTRSHVTIRMITFLLASNQTHLQFWFTIPFIDLLRLQGVLNCVNITSKIVCEKKFLLLVKPNDSLSISTTLNRGR